MKNDLNIDIMNQKLLETVSEISYHAGQKGYFTGNSREDVMTFIWWANEFETFHKETDWDAVDYIVTIEDYVDDKMKPCKNHL
jgi:hypothetical protein